MLPETDLGRLLDAMRAHGVTTLDIDGPETVLRLTLPVEPVEAVAAPPTPAPEPARSPDIGTFVPRGKSDGLAVLGTDVQQGEVLGYVANGAVRCAVLSPATGRIKGDAPATGRLCGFGDILFQVEPA